MKRLEKKLLVASPLLIFAFSLPLSADEALTAKGLFKQKCSLCHAVDKKRLGPAIKSMSDDKSLLRETIINGKNAMPAYGGTLEDSDITALVNYLLAKKNNQ